ncbi:SusC/RagA family TonB-linked outer membrane protein [Parabacteroides sp. HGS0025]|jgi:TonB-linked SusC/RagA family outer membrane protein|uniref:SusC/RagA family TonB-linked outer membrane protein n=1 Tax=Parabacteroides sp. HGS0025 TaxID=1078087 RepID=UPI0006176FA2|nr:SusC/RagA family TonB-linked outer membrane protein [Parabacteroides sp. HGS0025]KKB46782.1 SusC/RagA family TonB-linked outer membrane protein [Parabacteroides sp. HGS0025]
MKKKSNNITSVKHLCVGLTLCCAAVGAQAAPTDNAMETSNYVSAVTQQTKKITGVVVDETGFPVIGANIIEKGTTNGVITDLDGNFSLEVPDGAIIEISYIGYTTQEIPVKGQTNFNIKLVEDTQKIDEVVVTALGIKRQSRSLGYSTTQVQGEDFTLARDPNLGNALSGKVAGVSVSGNATGSGGSSRVIIRGNASLTGNNMPLYVVDGVPFSNQNLGSAGTWGGMDMGDGLNNINPDDIESIQVLKGAAASALYGYRGGNGAVLITTKSGKKGKPVSIEFNNNLTFTAIYDYRDYQKVFGQGTYGSRPTDINSAKASEQSSWGEVLDGGNAVNFLGNNYNYSYVDNWDNFYRTGINESASVAISGAADKITYRFGISNVYEKSILPNASNQQQGINLNTTYDILSNLHLMVNANYIFEKANGRSNLSDGNGNTNASLIHRGNSFDIRWLERGSADSDWGTAEDGSELLGGTNIYFNNPYWLQYRKTNDMNKNRLTGSMTLKYDITDWLSVQGAIQRDGFNMDFKQVQPTGAAADPAGWLTEYSKSFSEMNLNYLVAFNKEFGDWSIGATLGGNRQRTITKQYTPSDGGRPFIVDGLWSVNNLGDKRASKDYSEYRVNSVYATADFGWKNQLFLNLTGRNDWFSTLSPDNNSYFYPSVTLSWVFTDSFEMPEWFTFGKVRGSFATASNGTDPYKNLLLYQLRNYTVNGQNTITQNNGNQYPNANLKPVSISEWEGGLNLAFLNNRLSFDMAYYVKNTKDDIAVVSTSTASGYGSMIMNVGEIRNQGFEFMVNAVPVHTKDFEWNTTLNFAYNDSEVKYLGEGVDRLQIDGASSRSGNVTVQNIVGSSYGELVGYKYKRHNGQIVYENGIPQRADELSSLGNGVYNFTGGWSNAFKYKNFSLSFLLDFKVGAKLFSGTNYSLYSEGLHKNTLVGRTAENPGGSVVGAGVMLDGSGNYVPNTVAVDAQTYYSGISRNNIAEEFVYNANFLKLRELSLGYEFPQTMLTKLKVVKGLNVSLVGRNLWTIIKHTDNIDPEAAYNNSNGQGLELNGYPATRSVGFNVNVKF